MRLQKYLAACGVASRRKSEIMIAEGRVKVNGVVVNTPGFQVDPSKDCVMVDNRLIEREEKVYLMLNKPKDYVCTASDRHAKHTVFELLPQNERLFTVGRLDKDTEGILLLTNDGDLAYHLTHPSHEFNKTYLGLVKGVPSEKSLEQLANGVEIEEDGHIYRTAPAQVELVKNFRSTARIRLIIHEGRKRQVRKMCQAIGHNIIELKREAIGELTATGLKTGEWRYLTDDEVDYLKGEKNDSNSNAEKL